jgi:hypothetical protein
MLIFSEGHMLDSDIKYTPSNLFEQANSLFAQEKYLEALHLLTLLADSKHIFPRMFYLAAVCNDRLGRPERIINLLERELSANPTDLNIKNIIAPIFQEFLNNPCFSQAFDSSINFMICGLPPGHGGTGNFLRDLMPISTNNGYHNVHPIQNRFTRAEQWKLASLKDKNIVLLHPQTIGLGVVQSLIDNNNVSIYVLDNSFFCMQSYNHRITKRGECLDCLGNLGNVAPSCAPFPVPYTKSEYLSHLDWLKNTHQKISFICQTQGQASLLAKHFGPSVNCRVVGLKTDEFNDPNISDSKYKSQNKRYDIVYHGSLVRAKGILFFLELAAELPEFTFLVPMSADQALFSFGSISQRSNLFYEDVNWDSGLKDYTQSCRLVLCPSEWSAPIEMALLKSLEFNGSVGVLQTKYGFESEIPNKLLMRLSLNIVDSANIIRNELKYFETNRLDTQIWSKNFRASIDLSRIFN